MQPLIAITAGEIISNAYPWTPVTYGQFHTYADAIVHADGVPFIMPFIDDEQILRRLYEQCQGLLLSGGNDVCPGNYQASKSSLTRSTSPQRDKQEMRLLQWALQDNKPVFGICRGMQLINVALGGSLYQNITTDLPTARNHEVSVERKDFHHLAHRLKLSSGSQLAAILGTSTVSTNALHHQAIKKLGNDLLATAHAEDGVIEAIELPGKRFVIGVQSHPEALESATEPLWHKLFVAFVDSARATKRSAKPVK